MRSEPVQQQGAVRLLGINEGTVYLDVASPYVVEQNGTVSWGQDAAGDFGGSPVGAVLGADPTTVPNGVLERRPDGSESLRSVDMISLELDGHGGVTAWDQHGQRLPVVGLFYVHEIHT